ncbi:MAG: polyprenyl synthetase family protein [Candidatus Micrarchaeales archaeon]|nr:polyprenyl synthetase family protein [Candidatus Micrarchaeales archaeon]
MGEEGGTKTILPNVSDLAPSRENVLQYMGRLAKLVDVEMSRVITAERLLRTIRAVGDPENVFDDRVLNHAIIEPTKYLIGLGGKRWRPSLMITMISALGRDPREFMAFVPLVESIHTGTLVVDDVEDRSPTRRNNPSVHMLYGIDTAINVGSINYFYPIQAVLNGNKNIDPNTRLKLYEVYVDTLTKAHIAQGQDIAWHSSWVKPIVDRRTVTEQQYLQMVKGKTGSVAAMGAKYAAILCGADDAVVDAFGDFATAIGAAFQIRDDINNVTIGTGKEVGEDIVEGKNSLLVIYTLQHGSKEDGDRLIEIFNMKNEEKTPELIQEAIAIINKYGAIGYAQDVAESLVTGAWSKVDKVLPDSTAKQWLHAMGEFLINREV